MNAHKARKIERFEPILAPNSENLEQKVLYDKVNGKYIAHDKEAQNLIEFLGVNHPNLYKQRQDHIAHISLLLEKVGKEMFYELAKDSKKYLHFPTALKAELDIELSRFYKNEEI